LDPHHGVGLNKTVSDVKKNIHPYCVVIIHI